MSRDLFGTDGVRGKAGIYPLDEQGVRHIGMAIGAHFLGDNKKILIGHDTRESSSKIVNDLINALIDMGSEVINIGVISTPGLAYLTREEGDAAAGIMVTASHNTFEYNGIKVFNSSGGKLTDEIETTLNKLINQDLEKKIPGTAANNTDLVHKYEDFLEKAIPDLTLNEFSIAIDTANGAATGIAERVLRRLGADVTPLFDKPNGRNINDNCGATHTEALAKCVTTNQLSLGIALDGDADRVILIDDKGRDVKGDYILYILAVCDGHQGVVATVMSNLGFEKALSKKNIKLVRTDVGDRYVLDGLAKTGYRLGGEQSGHIINADLLLTGDGLLAAILLLDAIKKSGKSLSAWCDEITPFPQAMVNVQLEDKNRLNDPDILQFINQESASFDGDGRLLIRPSGTEPVVRVMVEANDAENRAQEIASKLEALLQKGAV